MRFIRFLPLILIFFRAANLWAESPSERAKIVTVTMTLNDVPPKAAAEFVELVSKIKVHFQARPGDSTVLSVDFQNTTADAALQYIAKLARMDLRYTADGAHFTPQK